MTATVMVRRSRFFSATVEPAAAVPTVEPNMSDSPPPRPECKRISSTSANEAAVSTPTRMSVSTCEDLLGLVRRARNEGED